jgi:hypothetical protein
MRSPSRSQEATCLKKNTAVFGIEDIAYVDGMFALFRQAGDTISRQADGR